MAKRLIKDHWNKSKLHEVEIDLAELDHPASAYSAETKLEAAMIYAVTGSPKEAAKFANVPHETVKKWATNAKWWPKAVAQCKAAKSDELDGRLTGLIHKATARMEEILENGIPEIDKQTGAIVGWKQIPLNHLTQMMSHLFDKRALQRGEATTRAGNEKDTQEDHIKKIQATLEQYSGVESGLTHTPPTEGGKSVSK
jgi:hypothetical protein